MTITMKASTFQAVGLAKLGFGTVSGILAARTDHVVAMLEYSAFLSEYQETAAELNRDVKP